MLRRMNLDIKTKSRKELPPYKKMDYFFDIDKLKKLLSDMPNDVRDFISNKCDTNSAYSSYDEGTYKMFPLTTFDSENKDVFENYSFAKNLHPEHDERRYTKKLDWIKGTYIEEVLSTFKGQVTRAHIRNLSPGGYLKYHMDYDTKYSVRYHIPITTNEGCVCRFKKHKNAEEHILHMPADGSCYFFNQGWLHAVENTGNTDRYHLIIAVNGQEDLYKLLS